MVERVARARGHDAGAPFTRGLHLLDPIRDEDVGLALGFAVAVRSEY